MAAKRTLIRKTAYGVMFTVVLPALLVLWAARTAELFRVETIEDPLGGALAIALGLGLMMWGMAALWRHGGGLPMNAFPPPRLVTRGIYGFVPHPIYTGFCIACFGLSIGTGSASAFWLVAPAVMVGCIALVFGYERRDLERRFGTGAHPPFHWLPAAGSAGLSWTQRAAFYAAVVLPWLALYELIDALGVQPMSLELLLPVERSLPVVQWTEWLYFSTYVAVLCAPLVLRSGDQLRRLSTWAWASMLVVFPSYLVFPTTTTPRSFVSNSSAGDLLNVERAYSGTAEAFPSYHVIWSILIAEAYAAAFPQLRWLFRGWAAMASAACITTGMHSIADVVGGIVLAVALIHCGSMWQYLRRSAEAIANSWHEWRIGGMRLINHGFYAGAGTLGAYVIISALTGSGSQLPVAFTAIAALLGAGAWAQWIEGSPRLLRPYGFYGGVGGVVIASLAAGPIFGIDPWLLMAAHCAAAPLLQSLGRMRCLVQGCCHGTAASECAGIRYTHPRSRVVRLSGFAGIPIHPTPLYSILWNIPVGLVMLRMWSVGAQLHLIAGVYLILTGAGRFVEEAYRGEPQTVFNGLRLYQWIAILTVVCGAVITAVATSSAAPAPHFTWTGASTAFVLAAIATVALGSDFPESNRRFARLT
jgi:protein-S-isoprenylcysteine O-methyltransferase Ste14